MSKTGDIIDRTLAEFRRSGKAGRRHPAEVTSDRLGDATDKWADQFTGEELDMIGVIRDRLRHIAESSTDA